MTCPLCGADVAVEQTTMTGEQWHQEPVPDSDSACFNWDEELPTVYWHLDEGRDFTFTD